MQQYNDSNSSSEDSNSVVMNYQPLNYNKSSNKKQIFTQEQDERLFEFINLPKSHLTTACKNIQFPGKHPL